MLQHYASSAQKMEYNFKSPEIMAPPVKRLDLTDSRSKQSRVTTQKACIKPLYPSQKDRRGTEDASRKRR